MLASGCTANGCLQPRLGNESKWRGGLEGWNRDGWLIGPLRVPVPPTTPTETSAPSWMGDTGASTYSIFCPRSETLVLRCFSPR